MLQTITNATRRGHQRRQQLRIARSINQLQSSSSAPASLVSSDNNLHKRRDAQSHAPSFCLPCTDSNINQHNNGIQSRRLHSLSYSQQQRCCSVIPTTTPSSNLNNCNDITRCTLHSHAPSSSNLLPQQTIQKRHKVFVSRHNNTINLSPSQITSYITSHLPHLNPNSSDFRINNTHVILKECPFCTKPTNDKLDNQYKLYISIPGGAYYCHRCGSKGSWYDFKSEIGGYNLENTNVSTSVSNNVMVGSGYNAPLSGNEQQFNEQVGSVANSGVGGGGVSQPWNYNTSNNQGMSYITSKQLNNNTHNNTNNNMKQKKIEPLPMPPKKLNSIYTTKLLNPTNSPTTNNKEYKALQYLLIKRGLTKNVLTKYGVGCATYNFPTKDKTKGSVEYVPSMCVTFPWLMRENEVKEQEELRGAEYVWKSGSDMDVNDGDSKNGDRKDRKNGVDKQVQTRQAVQPSKKKSTSEMTPLERLRYRQEKKARAKAAKDEEEATLLAQQTGKVDLKKTLQELGVATAQDELQSDRLVSSDEDAESLYGPYISRRIKVRSIEQKGWQRLDPPGGGFGLFGWHTVPHDATELIITEGEFDAMAVYQATGRPAVSLPNGCRSLPMEVLVLLERFDTIYLWMDNDGPGREGAEMFAKKLGVERCLLVQPSGKRGWVGLEQSEEDGEEGDSSVMPVGPPKDANEALLTGWDINELMKEASELPHERILKFSDLRDSVIHEIVNPEKYRGAAIPSLPGFTSLIKGFRRGEMTVLTGPTGSGKTTFLGQASLDLAEQGINVLWGSFEIKNTRLMHKLLQQYMKDVLPIGLADKEISLEEKKKEMVALTALADKFETLPMHFMKFHGGSDVDDVLDAMEYATYVHDVEHIILDNMQFMISRQAVGGKGSSYDKFDMQDIAIEKFRKFATDYNVHITLVVHPRKEDEGAKLSISSFYGSSKATQEADTVLILQSDGKRKFVDVKKNRFDGTLGHVPLYFQRKSGRYSENPETPPTPQRTSIPKGVSAMNGTNQVLGKARAVASGGAASVYHDIRNQHPIS